MIAVSNIPAQFKTSSGQNSSGQNLEGLNNTIIKIGIQILIIEKIQMCREYACNCPYFRTHIHIHHPPT